MGDKPSKPAAGGVYFVQGDVVTLGLRGEKEKIMHPDIDRLHSIPKIRPLIIDDILSLPTTAAPKLPQIDPAPSANLHGYLRGHFSQLAAEVTEDENALMTRLDKMDDHTNNLIGLALRRKQDMQAFVADVAAIDQLNADLKELHGSLKKVLISVETFRSSLPPEEKPETFESYVARRIQPPAPPSPSSTAAARTIGSPATAGAISPSSGAHTRSVSLTGDLLSSFARPGSSAHASPSSIPTAHAVSRAAQSAQEAQAAQAQARARTLSRGDELAPNPDTKPLPSSS